MIDLDLTVNGAPVRLSVEDRTSLADLIREKLDLTGTHLGCEHGACGACTVILDGTPVRSCIVLAGMCEGSDVRTAEGLTEDTVMEELRKQFHEKHALQCGFCTPGMLITARDILSRHEAPSAVLIRKELSGQICRCTGYVGIVAAIEAAGAALMERRPAGPASGQHDS